MVGAGGRVVRRRAAGAPLAFIRDGAVRCRDARRRGGRPHAARPRARSRGSGIGPGDALRPAREPRLALAGSGRGRGVLPLRASRLVRGARRAVRMDGLGVAETSPGMDDFGYGAVPGAVPRGADAGPDRHGAGGPGRRLGLRAGPVVRPRPDGGRGERRPVAGDAAAVAAVGPPRRRDARPVPRRAVPPGPFGDRSRRRSGARAPVAVGRPGGGGRASRRRSFSRRFRPSVPKLDGDFLARLDGAFVVAVRHGAGGRTSLRPVAEDGGEPFVEDGRIVWMELFP